MVVRCRQTSPTPRDSPYINKLIVAQERPAVAAKREKNLSQAAQLLEVLAKNRLGDLAIAWEALALHGKSWKARVNTSFRPLEQVSLQAASIARGLSQQM